MLRGFIEKKNPTEPTGSWGTANKRKFQDQNSDSGNTTFILVPEKQNQDPQKPHSKRSYVFCVKFVVVGFSLTGQEAVESEQLRLSLLKAMTLALHPLPVVQLKVLLSTDYLGILWKTVNFLVKVIATPDNDPKTLLGNEAARAHIQTQLYKDQFLIPFLGRVETFLIKLAKYDSYNDCRSERTNCDNDNRRFILTMKPSQDLSKDGNNNTRTDFTAIPYAYAADYDFLNFNRRNNSNNKNCNVRNR